jgi:hypothetical protein
MEQGKEKKIKSQRREYKPYTRKKPTKFDPSSIYHVGCKS